MIGSIFLIAGVCFITKAALVRKKMRMLSAIGCAVLLCGIFAVTDYVAVARFNQVPRFRYETVYDSRSPDQLVYKTLFFTAVQKNPGTENEQVEIVK